MSGRAHYCATIQVGNGARKTTHRRSPVARRTESARAPHRCAGLRSPRSTVWAPGSDRRDSVSSSPPCRFVKPGLSPAQLGETHDDAASRGSAALNPSYTTLNSEGIRAQAPHALLRYPGAIVRLPPDYGRCFRGRGSPVRSEEHTSEL